MNAVANAVDQLIDFVLSDQPHADLVTVDVHLWRNAHPLVRLVWDDQVYQRDLQRDRNRDRFRKVEAGGIVFDTGDPRVIDLYSEHADPIGELALGEAARLPQRLDSPGDDRMNRAANR